MSTEIAALEASNTWGLDSLPPEKQSLDSERIHKVKYKPDGRIERLKLDW